MARSSSVAWIGWLAPCAVAAALALAPDPSRIAAEAPLHARDGEYAGSDACRACHPDHHASWRRTFHSTMTQLPSGASVLGRFDGSPVVAFGASATPLERDGRFFMRLPPIGAEPAREAEVALCVGSRRYQQYFEKLEDGAGGTYRRLPILWHVEERRWMHLNGVFLEPDSDDWSAHQSTWNENCIFCHNTAVAPGIEIDGDERGKRFDSHAADLGIACEACHGPGSAHARRMRSPLERYRAHLGLDSVDDVVDPRELDAAASSALCGQCHSQRLPEPLEKLWTFLDTGPTFRPGDALEEHVRPVTRDTPTLDPHAPNLFRDRFWSDGTARLTAYEHLGLTQSPCFQGGAFACASCHVMHGGDVEGQIEPAMRGDRACTQCHADVARDVAAHTRHAPDSSGSRCLECHMPRIAYGILAIHRSHRVESPDVARDVEGGRPNACTSCHLDRSATWAADRMVEWWGEPLRRPTSRPDRAPLDVPEALASLHAGDAVQRAVYAHQLGRADGAPASGDRAFALAHLLVALGDGYGSVRHLARRSALALERELELGLENDLQAFDPIAPIAERKRRIEALLSSFERAASARLAPPRPELLLSSSHRLDLERVRALLELQSDRVISIGE